MKHNSRHPCLSPQPGQLPLFKLLRSILVAPEEHLANQIGRSTLSAGLWFEGDRAVWDAIFFPKVNRHTLQHRIRRQFDCNVLIHVSKQTDYLPPIPQGDARRVPRQVKCAPHYTSAQSTCVGRL